MSGGTYRDRRTGEVITEQVLSEETLRWFYESPIGSRVHRHLLNNRIAHALYRRSKERPSTRAQIAPFVERFGIETNELTQPLDAYPHFNAFFSRSLKPGARPFESDPTAFCSPADSKVLVYPRLDEVSRLPVKGARFTPETLLGSAFEARRFVGGAALVCRLAPYDYHRFHFPDDAHASPARRIRGDFHSVNPIALARVEGVFQRNARETTLLDTRSFGRIAYIEVGALTVASIVQTYAPGPVTRGQEKGFFQFGGSTLVLLFEPGAIAFDDDLVRDSAAGLEVAVRTGTRLGTAR